MSRQMQRNLRLWSLPAAPRHIHSIPRTGCMGLWMNAKTSYHHSYTTVCSMIISMGE